MVRAAAAYEAILFCVDGHQFYWNLVIASRRFGVWDWEGSDGMSGPDWRWNSLILIMHEMEFFLPFGEKPVLAQLLSYL